MQPSWKSSCFVFEDKLIDLFAYVKYVVMFGFFRLGNPIVLEIEGFFRRQEIRHMHDAFYEFLSKTKVKKVHL